MRGEVLALAGEQGGATGHRAELLAYGGGALATVVGVCTAGAVQLVLRAAAGRDWSACNTRAGSYEHAARP
ncbi:MAG: hypothetical protein FWF02_09770 [Micrococcales bacterium]|nr:hypothetical protein [Micrococcales bacterium]MCL2667975.1 hypothetical protein [Micrococcales bacterium]